MTNTFIRFNVDFIDLDEDQKNEIIEQLSTQIKDDNKAGEIFYSLSEGDVQSVWWNFETNYSTNL